MSKRVFVHVVALCAAAAVLVAPAWAQQQDIPLTNWTVPTRAGLSLAAADVTNMLPFIGITPCRVVDTRGNGFTGEWGPPNMTANQFRDFTIATRCGIPSGAQAVSFNFTVTEDPGYGFLRVYPTGGSVPVVSTLNWTPYQTVANAAIVPLGTAGKITVNTAASASAVIIDVNGYFGPTPALDNGLYIMTNTTIYPLYVTNASTSCVAGCGIYTAIASSNVTAYALEAHADATHGTLFGVYGHTSTVDTQSAGVLGRAGSLYNTSGINWVRAGVRGEGGNEYNSFGVLGIANNIGVGAYGLTTSTGALYSYAWLGSYLTGDAVYAVGSLTVTGAKSFAEPHPTDPSKEIRYVALEGPEAGTYFRGRGRLQGGVAHIKVPENFRMVTAEEGLTVQVTPIGRPVSIAVVSMDLNEIVLRGPTSALDDDARSDVEFFYMVNGVRKSLEDFQPVRENVSYKPLDESARMPEALLPEQKRVLIETGIYNEDGTVNMDTARALGWEREWQERREAAQRAAELQAAAPLQPEKH
jgi:hypothetical protein